MRFADIFFFFISLTLAGCSNAGPAGPEGERESLPHSHRFDLRVGDRVIQVQLAVTRAETTRGLMNRHEMAPDEGMLFVYPRPIQASFWMKNTPLPLDIGFFTPDGTLVEVYRMHPHDQTSVRSRSNRIQFALEMNQGWFSRNRVRPGAVLDLNVLREALTARGFEPQSYGL